MKIALTALWSVAKLVGLGQASALETTQTYEGHVATSPVSLQLCTAEHLVHGTLMYTRSGISIQVVGTLDGSSLLMHEFDKRGTVVGIYTGKKTSKGFVGIWHSPSTKGKEMPFDLALVGAHQPVTPIKLPDLTGTYEFNFGPKARMSTLLVQQVDPRNLLMAIQGVTGEPAHLSVSIDRTLLRLTHNQAIYTSVTKEERPIRLTFFNGGVGIEQLNAETAPQSLATSTITGHYIRTDADVPFFRLLN